MFIACPTIGTNGLEIVYVCLRPLFILFHLIFETIGSKF